MALGKLSSLTLLTPVLHRVPVWVRAGMEDYNTTLSDAQKIRQGPRCMAQWVQREALAQMREDPIVRGAFCPVQNDQLEGMLFAGQEGSANVSLLINKAYQFRKIWKTARNKTLREQESMTDGLLAFDGIVTHAVVAFWELALPRNPLRPEVKRVGIGEEVGWGFWWMHTIWDEENGLHLGMPDDGQPPLLPEPEVVLRKPAPATDRTRRVGAQEEDRKRKEAERKQDEKSRGKDANGHA